MLMTIRRINACVHEEANKIFVKGGSNMNSLEPNYHMSMDVLDMNNHAQGWRKVEISTGYKVDDLLCFHSEEPPKISLPCSAGERELVSI